MQRCSYPVFFSIICCICLAGCKKKIDCPSFSSTAVTTWFPYVANQSLLFQNEAGEQQTYTMQNTVSTEAYSYTPGGFTGNSGECSGEKVFRINRKKRNRHKPVTNKIKCDQEWRWT